MTYKTKKLIAGKNKSKSKSKSKTKIDLNYNFTFKFIKILVIIISIIMWLSIIQFNLDYFLDMSKNDEFTNFIYGNQLKKLDNMNEFLKSITIFQNIFMKDDIILIVLLVFNTETIFNFLNFVEKKFGNFLNKLYGKNVAKQLNNINEQNIDKIKEQIVANNKTLSKNDIDTLNDTNQKIIAEKILNEIKQNELNSLFSTIDVAINKLSNNVNIDEEINIILQINNSPSLKEENIHEKIMRKIKLHFLSENIEKLKKLTSKNKKTDILKILIKIKANLNSCIEFYKSIFGITNYLKLLKFDKSVVDAIKPKLNELKNAK